MKFFQSPFLSRRERRGTCSYCPLAIEEGRNRRCRVTDRTRELVDRGTPPSAAELRANRESQRQRPPDCPRA